VGKFKSRKGGKWIPVRPRSACAAGGENRGPSAKSCFSLLPKGRREKCALYYKAKRRASLEEKETSPGERKETGHLTPPLPLDEKGKKFQKGRKNLAARGVGKKARAAQKMLARAGKAKKGGRP